MITKIDIKNYRSIWDASITLAPFTLLIGANGTGKSNFLRLFKELTGKGSFVRHFNYPNAHHEITVWTDKGETAIFNRSKPRLSAELDNVLIFKINPDMIGGQEGLNANPKVLESGSGAIQVLDALKTGDREDLFDKIETTFKQYIPEIEKLSFVPQQSTKILQVREKYIKEPVWVRDLSDGTRFVLTLLTIIYQENPPTIIGIEEIDGGLHPRLFEKIIRLCFDITSQEGMPQIIATTHNPYLVDQFKNHEDAVIIVEKKEGNTTFTTLAERLKHLEQKEEHLEREEPLGSLWYSGFVGGVPQRG